MKKKIFLMSLMVMALLSIFAISAFAEGIVAQKTESSEYGTVIQLTEDPGLDNAKQYVSTLNKINDTGDSTQDYCIMTDGTYYYVFPSSYIVEEREDGVFNLYAGTASLPGLAQAMAEYNAAMSTSYYANYQISGSGGAKRLNEIVRFEFPSGVTSARDDVCCMRAYSKLVEVRVNYPINFATNQMFYNNGALKTVTGIENATGIGTNMFMFCRKLESVSIPVDTVKIPDGMFFGCGSNASVIFTIPNLAECTQLTTIGADAFRDSGKISITIPDSVTTIQDRAFQAGCKTGTIVINETSKLQTIGANGFNSCPALTTLYIPSTVTSIGEHAFHGCSYLQTLVNFENCQITELKAGTFEGVTAMKTLVIPKGVEVIENAFIGNKSLTKVYIPKSVTTIADTFVNSSWENQPANGVYIYTGNDVSMFAECARFTGANVISARDYDEEGKYTGINLVVGYSHCIVYNDGEHTSIEKDAIVSTYFEDIQIVGKCTACGYALESMGTIPALFACQGYSVQEGGSSGIVIGYYVNKQAIAEYEAAAAKTLDYGVFAVAQSMIGNNDIFDANGAAIDGIISVKLTGSEFSFFELKITGFTDENKDKKLAMGAYVALTDDEGKEYSYLQETSPSQGNKYHFTSYSEVINSLAK